MELRPIHGQVRRMKLYTVVECIPSRLIGLANLLVELDGQDNTRAEILDLVQPSSLRKGKDADPDMANKVIGAALELGLIEECEDKDGDKCIRIVKGALPSRNSQLHWERWISRRVLQELVEGPSRDMATIVAWIQSIRFTECPRDKTSWKARFETDGFKRDDFGLNNDARWDNLFDWCRFMGLLWQTHSSREAPGVVPDPAVLLARFIEDALPDSHEVAAGEFRARVGALFPMLDGGHIFRSVRQQIAAARGEASDTADRLSPGFGLALRELRDRKLIRYYCPDDQRTFLLFDDGERIAFVAKEKGGR